MREGSLLEHGVSDEEMLVGAWNNQLWSGMPPNTRDYSDTMDLVQEGSLYETTEGDTSEYSVSSSGDVKLTLMAPEPIVSVPFWQLSATEEYTAVEQVPSSDEIFFRTLIPHGSSLLGYRGSLLIGNTLAAVQPKLLESKGVTCLVNCSNEKFRPLSSCMHYMQFMLAGSDDTCPYDLFQCASQDIHARLMAGDVVLLFCPEGVQRSLCLAFAYMMMYEKVPAQFGRPVGECISLMMCLEYMSKVLKVRTCFTTAQARALYDLNRCQVRPKEMIILKPLARPKPVIKKKETRTLVKIKVKNLPKKNLVRGNRPLSSIKAEDIRRSLSIAPNSNLLRRNFYDPETPEGQQCRQALSAVWNSIETWY